MSSCAYRLLVPTILAGWLLAAGPAQAVLVAEVRDGANFFKPDAVKKANQVIREIHDRFKKDLVIETFDSVPADRKEQFQKIEKDQEARNRFFDEWARQKAREMEVNGIYILICRHPGHLQIEVGNETSKKAFTLEDRTRLRNLMLDEFKEKQYDAGLVKGAEFVRDTMARHLRTAAPAADTHTAPAKSTSFLSTWGGWLCIGIVVFLGIWLVIGLMRSMGGGGGMGGGGWGGGGGGFFPSLLGGLFGAAAGMWLYDSFFRGGSQAFGGTPGADPGAGMDQPPDTDYSGTGGDFGDGGGGGDAGGGGDFGGGDFGGGDFGGGDFGGGDFGGGDF